MAVPGVRDALQSTRARVAAVSPIVAGEAVAGLPALDGIAGMAGLDRRSRGGISRFSDLLVVDIRDTQAAAKLEQTGMRVHCAKTVMRTSEDKAALAESVLQVVRGVAAKMGRHRNRHDSCPGEKTWVVPNND